MARARHRRGGRELIASGEARVSYAGQVVDARDAKMVDACAAEHDAARRGGDARARLGGSMTRARRAMSVARVHDLPTEEEPLATACRDALQERLDGLNGLITGASRNPNYPGFGTVADAAALIKELLGIRGDSGDLLRAIAKAENDLSDAGEDLEDVDAFFPDMQRIYDNAANLLKAPRPGSRLPCRQRGRGQGDRGYRAHLGQRTAL